MANTTNNEIDEDGLQFAVDTLRRTPTGASRHLCIVNSLESGQGDECGISRFLL